MIEMTKPSMKQYEEWDNKISEIYEQLVNFNVDISNTMGASNSRLITSRLNEVQRQLIDIKHLILNKKIHDEEY